MVSEPKNSKQRPRDLLSKENFYYLLNSLETRRRADKIIVALLMSLIFLNVAAAILESVKSIHDWSPRFFHYFEVFSVVVFTIEYFLRLWSATGGEDKRPILSRVKYAFRPMALIDLLAILPFYLPLVVGVDLRAMRSLRLFRILRLLKLGRYSKKINRLAIVLKEKVPELLATLFVVFLLLIIAASGIYVFEKDAQPEVFSSIPAALWWAVATLTTVGYGDVYPITLGGKFFGGLMAIFGVGIVAVPAGILGSGLVEATERESKAYLCHKCGGKNAQ